MWHDLIHMIYIIWVAQFNLDTMILYTSKEWNKKLHLNVYACIWKDSVVGKFL